MDMPANDDMQENFFCVSFLRQDMKTNDAGNDSEEKNFKEKDVSTS